MSIYFYRVKDPYGCFSNFSPHGFELDGKYWPTSEHYFQAQKFADTRYQDEIKNVKKAIEAAQMGRNRDWPISPDWNDIRVNVMRCAVLTKFHTHQDIRQILLSTGNEEIIEETTDDYFWGCGTNRTGSNMLGKILMEVREKLKTE